MQKNNKLSVQSTDFRATKTVIDTDNDVEVINDEVLKVNGVLFLQIGVAINKDEAEKNAENLQEKGWDTYIIPIGTKRSKGAYFVYVGPYDPKTYNGV